MRSGFELSSVVASSAPGHQTTPYGTSAPKIFRPRIDGRPYVIVRLAPSIVAVTLSWGLTRARCTASAAESADNVRTAPARMTPVAANGAHVRTLFNTYGLQ